MASPLVCLVLVSAGVLSLVASDKAEFDAFVKKYKKNFKDGEHDKRYAVFKDTLKRIDELKLKGVEGIGINSFAATTPEEFASVSRF